MEDSGPAFFVGHHQRHRVLPVTSADITQAYEANYDILTSPITTPHFHSRVLSQLSHAATNISIDGQPDITQNTNASPIVIEPLTPADTPLVPESSVSQIIAVTSTWIDLASSDPIIADISRQILKLELAYAAFCGVSYVLLRGPRLNGPNFSHLGLIQYARAILDVLGQGPYMQLYISLPMFESDEDEIKEIGDLSMFGRPQFIGDEKDDSTRLDLFGTWEVWEKIRSICKYSARLGVALSMPKLLPPIAIQARWYSEPIRLLLLDSEIFSKNVKGYPVLSKAHQSFISRIFRAKSPPWFLLCNVGPIPTNDSNVDDFMLDEDDELRHDKFPTPAEASEHQKSKDPTPHLSYMRNLQNKQPVLTPLERLGAGYQDYLQAPLQPLTVNLESMTYEVFEKDPIKYEWYERATYRALQDWTEQAKPTSNNDGRVVVAVVGAGRGPLVTRALKASKESGVEIDMWALEKNPNAFLLLQRHNETIWNGQVNLVKSDMRTWQGPVKKFNTTQGGNHVQPIADSTSQKMLTNKEQRHYKIDILISELLGSFGDNELSPECLDGVQHLLNPIHGISIPSSYSSHLTPIAAPKLHSDISNNMLINNSHAAETPYVVMLDAIDYLSHSSPSSTISTQNTPIVGKTWSFHHPNPSLYNNNTNQTPPTSNNHNARHSNLSFPIPHRATCHGLAGYFETVLYQSNKTNTNDSVELSTNPNTMSNKSPDMISWFPIFFPLKQPIYIPDDSEMVINIWRRTDERKVWYEWIVDIYLSDDDYTEGGDEEQRQQQRQNRRKKSMRRIAGSELHSSEHDACLM